MGIVGAGAISRHACRELAAHPRVRLVGVADVNLERRESLATAFGVKHTFESAEALLERRDVDAVYIAVPNVFHAPMARAALEAGKHTLLEKPFALNHAAALTVAEAARRSGRIFMVGMNQRFDRLAQKAKRLVETGRLGEVYHVRAYWRRRAGIPRIGSWFGSKATAGGGALLDIGVHMLDLALHLVDNFRPVTVTGAVFTKFGNRGLGDGSWGLSEREYAAFDVDDFATAFVRLDGGVTVALDASWAAHQERSNEQEVLLYGTESSAAVYADQLFRAGESAGESVTVGAPAVDALPFPHASRFHHFVNAVLGDEVPAIPLDQSLAVQRILDAIYESARTGREVSLEDGGRAPGATERGP
jgi:predicted dehydrogenase